MGAYFYYSLLLFLFLMRHKVIFLAAEWRRGSELIMKGWRSKIRPKTTSCSFSSEQLFPHIDLKPLIIPEAEWRPAGQTHLSLIHMETQVLPQVDLRPGCRHWCCDVTGGRCWPKQDGWFCPSSTQSSALCDVELILFNGKPGLTHTSKQKKKFKYQKE